MSPMLRRSCVALLAALFVALAVLPRTEAAPARAGARPAARTLLLNPDFEKTLDGTGWVPAGWDTSIADLPTPTVFFGRDTFLVHSGRWSVSIANMSAAFPMGHNWSQTMLVGPETWGKMAVLKVWTRSNGLDGRASILLQAYRDTVTKMSRIWGVDRDEALRRLGINKIDDPLLDIGWKRTQFDDPLTEWVQREARAYVPPGTNVLFVRCSVLGTGQVLFDDASLTLEPAPPPTRYPVGENLCREPGFEEHGLGWDVAIPPYEGTKVSVDTTVSHSGRASIRLSDFWDGLVETRVGVGQPFEGRRLRGQRVRLSAWLKGDSLRGGLAYVKIYSQGQRSHVVQSPAAELLSETWDWKQLSIELDIPEDSDLVWANVVSGAPARGTVWIDDASFEVLGPASKPASPAKPAAAKRSATPKR